MSRTRASNVRCATLAPQPAAVGPQALCTASLAAVRNKRGRALVKTGSRMAAASDANHLGACIMQFAAGTKFNAEWRGKLRHGHGRGWHNAGKGPSAPGPAGRRSNGGLLTNACNARGSRLRARKTSAGNRHIRSAQQSCRDPAKNQQGGREKTSRPALQTITRGQFLRHYSKCALKTVRTADSGEAPRAVSL